MGGTSEGVASEPAKALSSGEAAPQRARLRGSRSRRRALGLLRALGFRL